MALFFASFRHSFAVLAFVTTDRALFDVDTEHPLRIVSPRNITVFIQPDILKPDILKEEEGARG